MGETSVEANGKMGNDDFTFESRGNDDFVSGRATQGQVPQVNAHMSGNSAGYRRQEPHNQDGRSDHGWCNLWGLRSFGLQCIKKMIGIKDMEPRYPFPSKGAPAIGKTDNIFRSISSVPRLVDEYMPEKLMSYSTPLRMNGIEGQGIGSDVKGAFILKLGEEADAGVLPYSKVKPQEVGKIAYIESAPTLKLNNCISYSKDKVTMGKGTVAHFVSSDGLAESEINKDLIKNQLFDVEGLQSEQPKPGDTVVYSKKNRYIFSMVVKNKKNDKVFLNFISNNLDFISWVSVEQILQQHFKDSGLHIAICSGEVISPPFHKRDEIIKEFHESVVGGHKGISKTYRRVRSSYYWDNKKSDVRRVLGGCKTCM